MSSPWVSFQVETISSVRRQAVILAGSEWVARMPPMAALFSFCPGEASASTTTVFRPRPASAMESGTPTDPAPTTATS